MAPDLEAAGGVGIGIDPLYLFACSVLWHKRADAGAGWELVRGMRLSGPEASAAAALLAKTENLQFPFWDTAGANDAPSMPMPDSEREAKDTGKVVVKMNTPYGLEIIENCVSCNSGETSGFVDCPPMC
ncbi:MAG TPA: hypothetical protein VGZ28_06070 [Terriglobales bacterium]|nr:hypothetical protein [Terriglobales bacterium]